MIKGKFALVTGGSRGIGFAIARDLVKNGVSVVITGRNERTLSEACCAIGEGCHPLVYDASDIEGARGAIERAAQILGGLDIVVNNAGIFSIAGEWSKTALLGTSVEGWERVMATNSSSIFFMMQAAVDYMLKGGIKGNILNVTSVAGNEPVYGAYGASKCVANSLTRGWGRMFASDGITINGIAPGPVATEMNNWHEGDPMEHSRIPYGRFATVDEVSALAMHLLDESAKMICGEVITLDGAYAIR